MRHGELVLNNPSHLFSIGDYRAAMEESGEGSFGSWVVGYPVGILKW